MTARLEGKRAVVTGAAQGIGRAIALGLAAAGADVAVLDIDLEGAEQTAEDIRDLGRRSTSLRCDVTSWEQIEMSVDIACESLGGPIGIAVANAGGSQGQSRWFLDLEPRDWHEMVDRNLTGAFHTGLAYGRHLASHDGGVMIFVSSQLGEVVRPGLAHYCAAKGGVRQLVRAMAADLASEKIRVNALAPGPTLTPGNQELFSRSDVREQNERMIPMGRLAEPEEMAGAAVFLASDSASYVTGATLLVDGGYTVL